MKSCERYSELLSDYIENSLESDKKMELEAHLEQCSECRFAAGGVVNLRRTLHELPAFRTSPDFETILRARIKLDRRTSMMPLWGAGYGGSMRTAAYAAAVVLLAVSVFYLWQRQTTKSIASPPSAIAVFPTQMQSIPNKTPPPVASAKILYTLDKVTPQLWPNLGVTRKGSDQSAFSESTDSLQANPKPLPGAMPVSHQTITF
jgi:hypothetical protein